MELIRTVKTAPKTEMTPQDEEAEKRLSDMAKKERDSIAKRIDDKLSVFPDTIRKSNYFIAIRPEDESLDSIVTKKGRQVRCRASEFPLHIFNQSKDKRKTNIELSYTGERGEFFDFLVYSSLTKLWAERGCPSGMFTFKRKDLLLALGMNPNKVSQAALVENSLVRMHLTHMRIHFTIPNEGSFGYSFPLLSGLGYKELKSKNNEVYFMADFVKNTNPLLAANHAVYAMQEEFIALKGKPIAGTLYSFLCCNKENTFLDQDDQITMLAPTTPQKQKENFLHNVEYKSIKFLKESGLIVGYQKEIIVDKDDGRRYKRFHFRLRNNRLRNLYRRKTTVRCF